jgi:hypothetical protein
MRGQEKDRDPEREFPKFEEGHRNAALAAKLLRINRNYDPLWNSGPRPPLIWRVGAGILGTFFLFFGGCFFWTGLEDHSVALFTVAVLFVLTSVRPLWNAFKPNKVDPASEDSFRE